ncbi:MAG TPA: hypothetical protein VGP93_13065, partial [Polyangiaceae bacterium]|nr:hypothetical protein [Polyangiaceae bacterium]
MACASPLDDAQSAEQGGESAGGGSGVAGASSGGHAGSTVSSGGSGAGGAGNGGAAAGTTGKAGAGGSGGQGGSAGGSVGTASGEPGVWENVTPAGVDLASDFGVMDVVADPARPSDLYVGICHQGIWRSTDFGLTWGKVSTGTNGSVLDTGRQWSTAIDNDQGRDPSSAPALYTANGYGSQVGVFKSTDWGVSFTKYDDGQDIYSLEMDPYDNQHLITGMHEGPGIAETTDG